MNIVSSTTSEEENLDNEVRKTIQPIDANEPEIGLWMD